MQKTEVLKKALALITAAQLTIGFTSCQTNIQESSYNTIGTLPTTSINFTTSTTYPPATIPTTYPPATVPTSYPPATVPTSQNPEQTTATKTETPPTQTMPIETTTSIITPTVPDISKHFEIKVNSEVGSCELWRRKTFDWDGKEIVIPSYYEGFPIELLHSSPFTYLPSLEIVILPETLTKISANAFHGSENIRFNRYGGALYLGTADNPYHALIRAENKDITSCEFHKDTKTVADGAFEGCSSLKNVVLSENLVHIGADIFAGCDNIVYQEYEGSFYLGTPKNPYFSLFKRKEDASSEVILHPNTNRIEYHAFLHARISHITFNENLKVIASLSFQYASGNYNITLPRHVLVEENAFSGASIQHLYIPNDAKIESYAFAGSNVKTAEFENGRTEIPANVFSACYHLTSVTIPNSVTNIQRGAFRQCRKLLYIDFPPNLIKIGTEAFFLCENLTLTDFPETTTTIEAYAFKGCKRIQKLYFPESITQIGESAFSSCDSLAEVTMDAHITNLSISAFSHCRNLTVVILPETLREIEYFAFAYCSLLKKITIPNGVREIDDEAFFECAGLDLVNLPKSLSKLGARIFYLTGNRVFDAVINYPGTKAEFELIEKPTSWNKENYLKNIVYGASINQGENEIHKPSVDEKAENSHYFDRFTFELTADGNAYYFKKFDSSHFNTYGGVVVPAEYNGKPVIGISSYAFANAKGFDYISIPTTVKVIDDYAFFGAEELTNVTFYGNVDRIGKYAFAETSLKRVKFLGGLDTIEECAFEGCSSLSEFNFPNSLRILGDSAFAGCKQLSVSLPGGLQVLGSNTFYGTGISHITWDGTSAGFRSAYLNSHHFAEGANKNGVLYVTCRDEVISVDTASDIKDGFILESLSDGTGYMIRGFDMEKCSQYDTLVLPATHNDKPIVGVRRRVFYTTRHTSAMLDKYSHIVIPYGYRYIGVGAFSGGYYSVSIPDSIEYIGEKAFENNRAKTIKIPLALTEIHTRAFYHCTDLTEVIFHNGITKIGNEAFEKTSLVTLQLPNSVTEIGDNAFNDCASLTTVILSQKLTSIGHHAFRNCKSLSKVEIPSSLRSIGEQAFRGCNLTSVSLPNGFEKVGAAAFGENQNLTQFTIPATIKEIGPGAFHSASIPPSIHYMGTAAQCKAFLMQYFENGTTFHCLDETITKE